MQTTTRTFLAAVLSMSTSATADIIFTPTEPDLNNEDIEIYDFAYGGSGCPTDTASAVISADYKKISIFFDAYFANSNASGNGRDRKSCNIGLSIRVPHGLTVALIGLNYRGYVDNAPGALAALQAEYFFAGESVGAKLDKVWHDVYRPVTRSFIINDDFHIGSIIWSPCGEDEIIRANTSLRAYKASNGGQAEVHLDTADVTSKIEYQLQWDTCYE